MKVLRGPHKGAELMRRAPECYEGKFDGIRVWCEPCGRKAGWVWAFGGIEPCCARCGRYSDKLREWMRGWYEWEPE